MVRAYKEDADKKMTKDYTKIKTKRDMKSIQTTPQMKSTDKFHNNVMNERDLRLGNWEDKTLWTLKIAIP